MIHISSGLSAAAIEMLLGSWRRVGARQQQCRQQVAGSSRHFRTVPDQRSYRLRRKLQRGGVSVSQLANARAEHQLSVSRELDPSKNYFYQLQRARDPEVTDPAQERSGPSEQHQQVPWGQSRA